MKIQSSRGNAIVGDISVPGDKSISHRAVIFSAIGDLSATVENIAFNEDVLCTVRILQALAVSMDLDFDKKILRVMGVGLHGLKAPQNPLNCGNSGTSMRLLCGLLCAQSFDSVLVGDASLMKRPMLRVAAPLRLMGAKIELSLENTAPMHITGNQKLSGIHYESTIPSAQVKSAILLAGLYAQGETTVYEKILTRDHTEKMLAHSHSHLLIPGDISSAAFFIVAATIAPGSDLTIRSVGINPLRTGMITILRQMGADITIFNETHFGLEPVADIRVRYAVLNGIDIPENAVVTAIDEFPAIFIAAVTAKGNTVLRGAKELRVKESDRIASMCAGLKQLGVATEEYEDGVLIYGDQSFQAGCVDAKGDHRIAMAFAIVGNIAKGPVIVDDCQNIATSFPEFVVLANAVGMRLHLLA